jgi:hypothetical protein
MLKGKARDRIDANPSLGRNENLPALLEGCGVPMERALLFGNGNVDAEAAIAVVDELKNLFLVIDDAKETTVLIGKRVKLLENSGEIDVQWLISGYVAVRSIIGKKQLHSLYPLLRHEPTWEACS